MVPKGGLDVYPYLVPAPEQKRFSPVFGRMYKQKAGKHEWEPQFPTINSLFGESPGLALGHSSSPKSQRAVWPQAAAR